jgi:hypothetical protein
MSDESQFSMNEMPLHDHHQDWTDGHAAVRFVGFNPSNGEAHFQVPEQHECVGVYCIWVVYGHDSGPPPGPASQSAYTYDGALPKRLELTRDIRVQTGQPKDTIRGIKVKRVGDRL